MNPLILMHIFGDDSDKSESHSEVSRLNFACHSLGHEVVESYVTMT